VEEAEIVAQMRRALNVEKRMAATPRWSLADARGATRLAIGLECDEADLVGIELCLRANANSVDEDVTAQLFWSTPERVWRIERIDWRPRQPHTNRCGPADLIGLTVETSIHPFEENSFCGLSEMQSRNLPLAIRLEPEPRNFDELLAVVRARFSVLDTSAIQMPPWSPNLFPIV